MEELIELIRSYKEPFTEAGFNWRDIEGNLRVAATHQGSVDRSLDAALMSAVHERQLEFQRANGGRNSALLKVRFYGAIGSWNLWCAAQHAASRSESATFECVAYATGWFAAANCLANGGEEYEAMTAAQEARDKLLEEWREKEIPGYDWEHSEPGTKKYCVSCGKETFDTDENGVDLYDSDFEGPYCLACHSRLR